MFRHFYRGGLTPQESELLRKLRTRGYALAIFTPGDVGSPMNRKPIEDSMVKAGKQTLKQMEVQHDNRNG
jgi:hypothetical protein